MPKKQIWNQTTKEYYKQTRNEYEDFVLHNVDGTTLDKMLRNLDVAKPSGIDQISITLFKDVAPVTAIYHANIIDLKN